MCDTETEAETETDSPSLADQHDDLTQLFKHPDDTSQDVVRSVFGMKHVQVRAYLTLLEHPHSSVKELADELDRHRNHIARALLGVYDAGLVEREQQTFDTGGKGYIYDPVPVEQAQQYLHDQLDGWVSHLRAEIETLDTDIECEFASDGGADSTDDGQNGSVR